MTREQFRAAAIIIFIVIVMINMYQGGNPSGPAVAPPVSDPPEIRAEGWLNNGPISVKACKGYVIVVEFWATWCGPCRNSIPHMIELYNRYWPKGVVFAAVSDEGRSKVEAMVQNTKMTYPVAYGSKTFQDYGVRGIPRAFVIGRDGKVRWSGHPASLEAEIQNALAGR